MPTDHVTNATNGNFVKKVAESSTSMAGLTSLLPIYDVKFSALKLALGDIFETVVRSMVADDEKDLIKGYRQPTNHADRLGNLPIAAGGAVVYREYYVPATKLPKAAYLRLLADLTNKRLYITPTHYDVWIQDRDAARLLNENTLIPSAVGGGAQNPFFRVLMGV